jgi:hypothetical protein
LKVVAKLRNSASAAGVKSLLIKTLWFRLWPLFYRPWFLYLLIFSLEHTLFNRFNSLYYNELTNT